MSLENLPCDIIFFIANFLKKEYANGDEDDNDNGSVFDEKQLIKEYGEGEYYPAYFLYATCSKFKWLSTFEYICVETGEFYASIVSRNINGKLHGMSYDGTRYTGILGYSSYGNGKLINENIILLDCHNHYRRINGVQYHDEPCRRWWGNCEDACETCIKFNEIQHQIFAKDKEIKRIFKSNYGNGTVVIRKRMLLLQFNYCVKNLNK